MEMVSKPCQDHFLHPILVHSIIEKKEIQVAKWGTQKIFKKTCMLINVITITFGPHSSPSNIATREKSQKYTMGYKRDSEDS